MFYRTGIPSFEGYLWFISQKIHTVVCHYFLDGTASLFVCKNPRNLIRFQTHGVLHNIPSAKALTYSHYEEIIAIKHLVSSTPILGSIISKYNSSHINTPVVILFWIVSTFCGTLVIALLLSVVYPWLRHYFPWSSRNCVITFRGALVIASLLFTTFRGALVIVITFHGALVVTSPLSSVGDKSEAALHSCHNEEDAEICPVLKTLDW